MPTHSATKTSERRERAAAPSVVRRAVQQAVQQSMDRRDNGGPTGHAA